jgi:dUTP pyrophosphatase
VTIDATILDDNNDDKGELKMILKVKKLNPDAIAPFYQHAGDEGMDLHAIEAGEIKSGKFKLVKTGISIALPSCTEAQIRPRSGLAFKNGITVLNSPGTIDEGYRGEIGVILINHGESDFSYKAGDRIAQMVIKESIARFVTVDVVADLDETDRSVGGFGSTGV